MPESKPPRLKVKDLARLLGCPWEGDGEAEVSGAAGLENAGPGDLVFLSKPKFQPLLEATRATAAILPPDFQFSRIPVLRSANPHLTFIRAVELLWKPYRPGPGIHPLAVVAPSARIGEAVSVGALSVIGEEAEIGEGTVIFPLVAVYPKVKIGRACVLHSHVSLREGIILGDRVTLHNGVVVGSDGFGYLPAEDGSHLKIPQKGMVLIEDDVEVGANTAIDRAALGQTVIRRGTKIDNLVQVAHNVEIGPHSILAGQAGIAGSSKIGRRVILSGQVGIADHVEVGDEVVIAAKSGVTKNVPPRSFVAGSPHLDIHEWRKVWAALPQLYDLIKEVRRLRGRVEELEKSRPEKTGRSRRPR
jgi:UDP-3-O-[3-hydroxymyristoyl] glucosamine N-acyltransferase